MHLDTICTMVDVDAVVMYPNVAHRLQADDGLKVLTKRPVVPAEAEIVIEGLIDTEYVEPEAPFGESHGHIALEEFNMPMRVTRALQTP